MINDRTNIWSAACSYQGKPELLAQAPNEGLYTVEDFDKVMKRVKGRAMIDQPGVGVVAICNKDGEQYILNVAAKLKLIKESGWIKAVKLTSRQTLEAIWWNPVLKSRIKNAGINIGGEGTNKYIMVSKGNKDIYFNISSGKYVVVKDKKKISAGKEDIAFLVNKVVEVGKKTNNIMLWLIFQIMQSK